MGLTLNIDTKGVEAKFSKAKQDINKIMADKLNNFAIKTVNQAKVNAPVDEGFLRNAISFEPANTGDVKVKTKIVVAANYAAYIEFGTRRFAEAYVSTLPATWQEYAAKFKGGSGGNFDDFILRIMGWVKRKGIEGNGAAYLIARSILRNGIKPHPFFVPAVEKNFEELKQSLK